MMHERIRCGRCCAEIEVNFYSKFVPCPYCGVKIPFKGFHYSKIDLDNSKYAEIEYFMDCPACRSPNAYLGAEGRNWRCPDCGYRISARELDSSVLWFCDDCDAYLNIQPGFNTAAGRWQCAVCGADNDVTEDNID